VFSKISRRSFARLLGASSAIACLPVELRATETAELSVPGHGVEARKFPESFLWSWATA
jgi:hypothetical protein